MKDLFPEFDTSPSHNYQEIWRNATFVFDTNVLLNLYRYQSATREALLKVLERLGDRIWICHYTALEFQRNRLRVIAEQSRRFAEVREIVEKAKAGLTSPLEKLQLPKRHALIDPQPLIDGFDRLVAEYLAKLDALSKKQQDLLGPDPLKNRLELLFDGKVGGEPTDQKAIDDLFKNGEYRYKFNIPPGYKDDEKDKDEPDEFLHKGIVYKRKFGDYLIWQQMLGFAKSMEIRKLIFVTDDAKEDWWQKVQCRGLQTVGPRTELVQEAKSIGGISTFLMYNPEQFLKYSKEYLNAVVPEEALQEVRQVTLAKEKSSEDAIWHRTEQAFFSWLTKAFGGYSRHTEYPVYLVASGTKQRAFKLHEILPSPISFRAQLKRHVYRTGQLAPRLGVELCTCVLLFEDADDFESSLREAKSFVKRSKLPAGVHLMLARLSATGGLAFVNFV
jgi:predicted nucleic acid-binding protein